MKLLELAEQSREIWHIFDIKERKNIVDEVTSDLIKIGAELSTIHKFSEENRKEERKYVCIILGVSYITEKEKNDVEVKLKKGNK